MTRELKVEIGTLFKTKHSLLTYAGRGEHNRLIFVTVYYFQDNKGEEIDSSGIRWHLPIPGITTAMAVDEPYLIHRIENNEWQEVPGSMKENDYCNYTQNYIEIVKRNRDDLIKQANEFVEALEKSYNFTSHVCITLPVSEVK